VVSVKGTQEARSSAVAIYFGIVFMLAKSDGDSAIVNADNFADLAESQVVEPSLLFV